MNFIIDWVGISKNCTDFAVIHNCYIHRIKSLWLSGIADSVFLIMYTFGWQMALGVELLVFRPDTLRFIPGSHKVAEENPFLKVVL